MSLVQTLGQMWVTRSALTQLMTPDRLRIGEEFLGVCFSGYQNPCMYFQFLVTLVESGLTYWHLPLIFFKLSPVAEL